MWELITVPLGKKGEQEIRENSRIKQTENKKT